MVKQLWEGLESEPRQNLREFIDELREGGYTVADGHTPDPDLIDPQGNAVETWYENYPYDHPWTATSMSLRSTTCRWSC